jgi:glycosyltransferase involved in cell wall biosynthesis
MEKNYLWHGKKLNKPYLLIVGAFPIKNKVIYGGILKSCKIILDSPISKEFRIIPLNSSQISNPPPGLIVRTYLAFIRLIKLIGKLIYFRPKVALIFVSDGAGAIEKGIMVFICSIFKCKTLLFPRAGNLITQTSKSQVMLTLVKFLYKKTNIFLCQGSQWKNYAINTLGINESKTKIISNWTATKSLIEIGESRKFQNRKGAAKILFVGWLEDFKGVFELLEAAKNLNEEGFHFELTLAGKGHAENDAKEFVIKNNLSNVITFAGWADDVYLKELLKSNEIFVLPSWAEGLPNSMIEAMASGLAVVITPVGVVKDFIVNEKNGLLVETHKVSSLEAAIKKLIINKELTNTLAINGLITAKTYFSSEQSIKNLLEVIKEITHKK